MPEESGPAPHPDDGEIFLDTSIIIARILHGPDTERRISDRVLAYNATVTGLIVRQEYKRRVLKDAAYLLSQLNDKGSVSRAMQHVNNVLPPRHRRKATICLNLVALFPDATEPERTERAIRQLRALLKTGMAQFDSSVNRVLRDSGCVCALAPVVEKKPYSQYDFGTDLCSKLQSSCPISDFVEATSVQARAILDYLQGLAEDKKTNELQRAEAFLTRVLANPEVTSTEDPCKRVGDVLIALESAHVQHFYTLNGKESQHLCKALGQCLVVRPTNPEKNDVVCPSSEESWPEF